MDKSRFKRPPDVEAALSSMLWTPYDQTTNASDSLSDDEREREKRKLNRYSNPLPSSLNWWNSHVGSPSTLRYSYPFHGNCTPSTSSSSGQTQINTPSAYTTATTTTMVHSFTDDFYQYQHHQSAAAVKQHQNYTTNCQSTHKYHKSQPSLPHINIINNNRNDFSSGSGSVMANEIIDTHLVSTSPIINALPMQFNHQRTNVRTLSSAIWQNNKAGNVACSQNIAQHSNRTSNMNVMVAPSKQISCNRNSKENATHSSPHDNGADYRLSCAINNRSKCRVTMNGAEEFNNLNNNSTSSTATMVQIDNVASIRDLSDYCNTNPQMPSSSSSHVQSQQFIIPVSLTNNVAAESRTIDDDALRCNNNNNYKDSVVDVNRMSVVECNQNMVEDAIIVTSAIDNLASSSSTHGTPNKAKYSDEIVTVREKRRRNRRDRRLARTRALSASGSTSEILPDILTNPRPPPYSSLPPPPAQQQIPSIISTVPVEDTRYTFSLPLVRRSTSDRSGKDCCGQWFNGPPLRFLVALVALGGVACTLGGATLGSIALAGSPTSHLTAGLLMTGVGIVLVTISGIAWRMSASEAHQCTGRCGRRQCSRGNSSFGLLYPEFQHRPPPPSYQASMQEHRLRIMMLDRERQTEAATTTSSTRASPPPTYHSNAGTLLRPALQFQRQSHTNNVQVEIPIDNEQNPCNSSAEAGAILTTSSLGYLEHQSPASSQTITTIASINRPDDNALSQCSRDVPSLIKLNSFRRASDNDEHDDIVGIHIALNGNICSRTCRDRVRSSSSRCTSSSDRQTICIKDSDDHHHHDTDIRECKNVNISTELNKALMSNPHLSSVATLPRNVNSSRASFLRHDRCELGIR